MYCIESEDVYTVLKVKVFFSPLVSLQLLGVDIRQMSKGLKEATKELIENRQNKKLKVSLNL